MSKWTLVSIRVTQKEKEQLKQFVKDYAKVHKIHGEYTLNKHLKQSVFSFMNSFYKEYPKDNVEELREQLNTIQNLLNQVSEKVNKM